MIEKLVKMNLMFCVLVVSAVYGAIQPMHSPRLKDSTFEQLSTSRIQLKSTSQVAQSLNETGEFKLPSVSSSHQQQSELGARTNEDAEPVGTSISHHSVNVTAQDHPLSFAFVSQSKAAIPIVVPNEFLPLRVVKRAVWANVQGLPLPVAVVNKTLPLELSNLPLPVTVTNESLLVTVRNALLNVTWPNSPLAVGIVNRTLTVDLASLPLPVGIVNQTLNVNVGNAAPIRTTVEQPVEVTSNQLVSNLIAIDADVRALQSALQLNNVNAKRCPDINSNGIICYPAARSCFCSVRGRNKAFADAVVFCESFGFDGLVSLQTKDKSSLVTDLFQISGLDAWTSGSKSPGANSNFVWTTTGEIFTETDWNSGEPGSRNGARCVKLLANGRWASVQCTDKPEGFICELANVSNPVG